MSSRSAEDQLGRYWQQRRNQRSIVEARACQLWRENPLMTWSALLRKARAEIDGAGGNLLLDFTRDRNADSKP